MISSLRDAKAKLGELVQKAAAGEDVVITVRGEPTVRLSAIKRGDASDEGRGHWIEEAAEAAQEASVDAGAEAVPSQASWDELRADRI